MARILVVEDDPDQLHMRKLILEHAGYEVVTAQNAAEAIGLLHGCRLIVMDLRLPTPEDGQRLIRAASGSAKIIVLSGDADTALPVDEFLTKPCSSRKLLETVAKFCLLFISLCVGLCTVLHAGVFTVSKASEVVAELDMRAVGTDWAEQGREARLATLVLDGEPQQQVMLYAGSDQFTYTVFLGKIAAGEHRLDYSGQGVELIAARFREDASDVVANAPVFYARANTIGKFTDIPLVLYCERLSENGNPFLQYTLIFSNEDGGTSTRALMARWGRTTDVEYVYRAFLSPDGSVHRATIQVEDHKEKEFKGHRDGSHPLLMPVTDNNMIGEVDKPNPIRYQIAPVLVDLAGHSREEVMDQHPITYKLMSKEIKREEKLRPFGTVDGEKISDPRNYLYVEMQLGRSESSVATLVRLKNGSRWFSSHLGHADFAIRTWKRNSAESPNGFVRTTVELPPGTKAEQIAEIGFECLVPEEASDSQCRVEAVTKCFFLDREYTPDTNVWTLTAPHDIPPGAIWTSALK
jgi:CheY-like chemotaxis protein